MNDKLNYVAVTLRVTNRTLTSDPSLRSSRLITWSVVAT